MSSTPFGKENFFSESQIRQCIALFGSVFSDMYILRGDTYIKLPIRFGNGYMYEKVAQTAEARESTKTSDGFPSMSYVFGAIERDPSRMTQRFRETSVNGKGDVLYGKFPYNISFSLKTRTKHLSEDLQLLEQIATVFAPTITVKINPLSSTTSEDVQQEAVLFLESIGEVPEDFDTDTESKKFEREYLFTLKTFLYPRTQKAYVINEIVVNTMIDELELVISKQSISDVVTQSQLETVSDAMPVATKKRKQRQ